MEGLCRSATSIYHKKALVQTRYHRVASRKWNDVSTFRSRTGLGRFNNEWIIEEIARTHWISVQRTPAPYSF